jgi:hypothetical protein
MEHGMAPLHINTYGSVMRAPYHTDMDCLDTAHLSRTDRIAATHNLPKSLNIILPRWRRGREKSKLGRCTVWRADIHHAVKSNRAQVSLHRRGELTGVRRVTIDSRSNFAGIKSPPIQTAFLREESFRQAETAEMGLAAVGLSPCRLKNRSG